MARKLDLPHSAKLNVSEHIKLVSGTEGTEKYECVGGHLYDLGETDKISRSAWMECLSNLVQNGAITSKTREGKYGKMFFAKFHNVVGKGLIL